MNELRGAYTYEPVASKERLRSSLQDLQTRPNIGNRALFELLADYVATMRGFDKDVENRVVVQGMRGPLTVTYGLTSARDHWSPFSEAWGTEYIERFRDQGKRVLHDRTDSNQEYGGPSSKAQRIGLIKDLQHGLDSSLPPQE